MSRRHAYLTLEHLLYALAHDADGERILAACGADLGLLRRNLSTYLDESIDKLARGQSAEEVLRINAPPGYSEHHSGRAADRYRGRRP